MTTTQPSCLIRYIEIWTPGMGGDDRLHLDSCKVVESGAFRDVGSSITTLAAGEGIAGSALQQRAPVIFQGLPGIDLSRVSTQSGVSITAMIAFPVFDEHELVNVIGLGLVDGDSALEIWSRDDRDELAISGSYYRGLESLDYISRYVRFPKGAGLPGYCWKHNQPKMLIQPASHPGFIRSLERDTATLNSVLGIPVRREYGFPNSILLLMSAENTPLANYVAIAKVDSAKPTEKKPNPSIVVEAVEGSTLGTESVSWHRHVTKAVAATRSTCLFSANHAEIDAPGIAIPCFHKNAIDRVVFLKF